MISFSPAIDHDRVLGLACRDRDWQAPFERIATNQSDFIYAEYPPPNISIKDPKDPQSMKFKAIVRFFKHIAEHEVSHGIENAFRFKNVLSSCRKGSLIPAQYKDLGTKPDADKWNIFTTGTKSMKEAYGKDACTGKWDIGDSARGNNNAECTGNCTGRSYTGTR